LLETFYRLTAGSPSGAIESFEILGMQRKRPWAVCGTQMSASTEEPHSIHPRARWVHFTRKAPALRQRMWRLFAAAIERPLGKSCRISRRRELPSGDGNWFRD
jgi:hypothetical protein